MTEIRIRPELRTAGGEKSDIMLDDQYVGSLTLVYREGDRMAGAVQLEDDMLGDADKAEVLEQVGLYVQGLIDAVGASECEVIVTHSPFEDFISTAEDGDASFDDLTGETEERWEPIDRPCHFFELMAVSETEDAARYRVYDEDGFLIADVAMEMNGDSVEGAIDWAFEPMEEEMEGVAHLIAAEFVEDAENLSIEMQYDGQLLQTFDWTQDEWLYDEPFDEEPDLTDEQDEDDYAVRIVRDDGDTLTYDIFELSDGPRPIGTATVDLGSRDMNGYIDFHRSSDADHRLYIAKRLMDEVDKEKDCFRFNVTMMSGGEVIEEILLETEPYH